MTDELKQLAEETAVELSLGTMVPEDDFHWGFEPNKLAIDALEAKFREVQRQTVEAAERAMDSELTQDEARGEVMVFANGLLRRLKGRLRRALLSPAQEVRNG